MLRNGGPECKGRDVPDGSPWPGCARPRVERAECPGTAGRSAAGPRALARGVTGEGRARGGGGKGSKGRDKARAGAWLQTARAARLFGRPCHSCPCWRPDLPEVAGLAARLYRAACPGYTDVSPGRICPAGMPLIRPHGGRNIPAFGFPRTTRPLWPRRRGSPGPARPARGFRAWRGLLPGWRDGRPGSLARPLPGWQGAPLAP